MTLAEDEVKDTMRAALPLVLAVNCLSDCELERRTLSGVARFESVVLPRHTRQSFNALIEEAAVLVLLSLHDLPPSLQHQAFMPSLVVVLSSDEEDRETAAAQQLGVQRLLQVQIDSTDAFADTAVTLMLDLLRRTHEMAALPARHGTWTPTVDALRGMRRARGLSLGLVGLGPVASGVARRASAFGMRVAACDPHEGAARHILADGGERSDIQSFDANDDDDRVGRLAAATAEEWAEMTAAGATRVPSLRHLLETSDVVSLHAVLDRVTTKMMDATTLGWMRPGAQLVNVASGALVNAVALKTALIEGRLGGAALDCPEGATWLEAWVRDVPNLILTPHVGFYSEDAFEEQRARAAADVRLFLETGMQADVGVRLEGAFGFDLGARCVGGLGASGGTSLVLSGADEDEHKPARSTAAGEDESEDAYTRL